MFVACLHSRGVFPLLYKLRNPVDDSDLLLNRKLVC
jgi:hypothetical protein